MGKATQGGLLTLQRRFVAALQEPIFGDSRSRTDLPPRDGAVSDTFVDTADHYISPSAQLAPVERLELYHRQYWYRLLDALAEDFPALHWLLGDDTFWALLESYLEITPPRSFTMRHLGDGLAECIAARLQQGETFLSAGALNIPLQFAADLARLEYALCTTFEAAERPPIEPQELAAAPVALQPHLQLLALHTPADVIWRRADQQRRHHLDKSYLRAATPDTMSAGGGVAPRHFLVVFRESNRPRLRRLPQAAFLLLEQLATTHSLEAAVECATQSPAFAALTGSCDGAVVATAVQRWFSAWVGSGWICRHQPERQGAKHG